MASVLAIVSKALFEKMVPKNVKLGTIVDTDRYASKNKTFDGLKKGGSIFMITVRPPDEKLWLVAIVDKPAKKGENWVGGANATPLTDITSLIKKFEFESGTGITAKKGALGMSLQTPRALTAADEKLIRDLVSKTHASGAHVEASARYREAVDAAQKKPKSKSNGGKLGALRLENYRQPFAGKIEDLEDFEKKQIGSLIGKGTKIETMFAGGGADEDEGEMNAMEIVDVVDAESGEAKYQLYVYPYGDGAMFANRSTKMVISVCQHSADPMEDLDKAFMQDFAKAWMEGSKRLKMWTGHIHFADDESGEADDDD